jgi:phage/plasmid-associated DNA primase
MRSLSVLLGQFYAEMDTANILEKTAAKMDLAKGSGCRIWSFNETPQNARLKSDVVQMLSGGDGIPVKVAHRQSQTLTPYQKCIVTTNHLPELGIVTEALRSRLMIVRFPVVFKDLEVSEPESEFVRRIDPGLKRRVEENLPTFLKWLVEGSMDWYTKNPEGRLKNVAPLAVKEATENYLQRFDTFAAFLDAKCVLGPNLKATTKELLVAYKDFFGEDIEGRSFAKLMTSYSPAKNIGRAKLNGYKGLSLK